MNTRLSVPSDISTVPHTHGSKSGVSQMLNKDATDSARRSLHSLLNVIIYPAPDLEGQWLAHCLETDIISQGNSVADALEMMAEAIELTAAQNVKMGRPAIVYQNAPTEVSMMFENAEDITTRILRIPSEPFKNEITISPHVVRNLSVGAC